MGKNKRPQQIKVNSNTSWDDFLASEKIDLDSLLGKKKSSNVETDVLDAPGQQQETQLGSFIDELSGSDKAPFIESKPKSFKDLQQPFLGKQPIKLQDSTTTSESTRYLQPENLRDNSLAGAIEPGVIGVNTTDYQVEVSKLNDFSKELLAKRDKLDPSNKLAVDEFNQMIDAYNKALSEFDKKFPANNLYGETGLGTDLQPDDAQISEWNGESGALSDFNPLKLMNLASPEGRKQAMLDLRDMITGDNTRSGAEAYTKLVTGNLNTTPGLDTPIDRLRTSFGQGITSIPEGLVGVGKYATDKLNITDPKKKTALQQNLNQWIREIAPENPNFVEQLSSGAGSMTVFLPFGMGVTTLAKALGTVSPKLAYTLGTSAMTVLESMTEAGSVYNETGNSAAAEKSFLANMLLIGITNKLGIRNENIKNQIFSKLTGMSLEGLQEGGQEVISAYAKGEQVNWDEVLTSGAIGAIIGIGVSDAAKQDAPGDTRQTLNVDPKQVDPKTGFTNFKFDDAQQEKSIKDLQNKQPIDPADAKKKMQQDMQMQAEIMIKAGIPEEKMTDYALSSVADGKLLRNYLEEVQSGELTIDEAAQRVKRDYGKMVSGEKEAEFIEPEGEVKPSSEDKQPEANTPTKEPSAMSNKELKQYAEKNQTQGNRLRSAKLISTWLETGKNPNSESDTKYFLEDLENTIADDESFIADPENQDIEDVLTDAKNELAYLKEVKKRYEEKFGVKQQSGNAPDNNKAAIERMLKEGKNPFDIAEALKIPFTQVMTKDEWAKWNLDEYRKLHNGNNPPKTDYLLMADQEALDSYKPSYDTFAKNPKYNKKPSELDSAINDLVGSVKKPKDTEDFTETEQEAMKRVNPVLYKLAQKAPTVDDFIKAVAKANSKEVKDIATKDLIEWYGKVEKPQQPKVEKPKKVKQPKKVEKQFDPKPIYNQIIAYLEDANDKSLTRAARTRAKGELAKLKAELLKNFIAAQIEKSGTKWIFKIDGKKQNKITLGIQEKAEKVKPEDVEIENENAKIPFEKLPDSVVRKQTLVAEQLVRAEDLPKGIGEAALKKGVQDIKEDAGKEQNPEAQIVRDAAEDILKNGHGNVVQIKGAKRQDLSAEEINDFVDEQIKKEDTPEEGPKYLREARQKLADLENDAFADDAEIETARKKLKAAENKFADEQNKLIDVAPTKKPDEKKPEGKPKELKDFEDLLKNGTLEELKRYLLPLEVAQKQGQSARQVLGIDADELNKRIKQIKNRIAFKQSTNQDMSGAAEEDKQGDIFDQEAEQKPEENQKDKIYPSAILKNIAKMFEKAEDQFDVDRVIDSAVTLPLSGDRNKATRQKLIKDITGEDVPKAKAGITEVKRVINEWFKKNQPELLTYKEQEKPQSKLQYLSNDDFDKLLMKGTDQELLDYKEFLKTQEDPYSHAEMLNRFLAQHLGNAPQPKSKFQQKANKTRDKLDDAIDDLLGSMGKLTSGVDPEQLLKGMKVVKLYTEMNVYKFADIINNLYTRIGEDVRTIFDAIKQAYGAYLADATDEIADQMDDLKTLRKFDFDQFISEISDTQEDNQDVSDRPENSQRDSENGDTALSDNQENVQSSNGDRSGRNRIEDNEADTGEGINPESSTGTSGSVTPSIGIESDQQLSEEDQRSEFEDDDAGNSNGRGSDWASEQGEELQFDNEGEELFEEHNKDVSSNFKEQARLNRIKQKDAEKTPAKLLDRSNIDDTLPYLLPAQRDDVYLAEVRFNSKEHQTPEKAYGKGILFTNGTGTGKTLSGLGIVKRFLKQGKKNILIVTPSQPKVNDWIGEGKNLLIDITALNSTQDKGKGVNVTTFANFRSNEALKNRDFDLIIYDESHRIMETKDGQTSSTTVAHYKNGNASEHYALERLKDVHPLWIEHKALMKEFRQLNISLNNDSIMPEIGEPRLQKVKDRLDVIEPKMKAVEPALIERANEAYKNTKVIFLSATPFKAHFNLRYANRFLFDWGNKTTHIQATNVMSRVDAESQFYLDNFGAAYEWKFHRLQTKVKPNPEAIAMQEIEFNEKLKADGVAAGRIIDSEYDYSRDFPVVAGFDNGIFNKAFGEIFNYSNEAEYTGLRAAAADVFMDYNYTTQLFESMKAGLSTDRIKKHLALDRKVVVFHRRQQGNATAPFITILNRSKSGAEAVLNDETSKPDQKEAAQETLQQVEKFRKKYASLLKYEQTIDYRSAVVQLGEKFKGRIGFVNGNVSTKEKIKAIHDFNQDDSGIDVLVVQEDSGKEGISLHDTTNKFQRVLMSLSMPISSTTALQIEGRIYRIGQASNAIFEYPLLGLDLEVAHFGQNINKKVSTTENLALGELSRDLLRSYSEGVLFNSTTNDPDIKQGFGGKEYDKKAQQAKQTEFQRARLVYATNQKTRGKRDNRQGIDFYPTPEPLGQKMVEWANVKEGENVLEPSAGNGAIAMWTPKNIALTAIEPSFDLFSKLSARASGSNRKIIQSTFEDFNIINKFNAVVMNPPFGAAGTTALEHVKKAYQHLRNGGRIVALVPKGAFDKKFEKWQSEEEFPDDLHIRSKIDLPSVTFEQAGTAINAQILIIDKFANAEDVEDADILLNQANSDYSYAKTIDEFFDEIEDHGVMPRVPVPNIINHQPGNIEKPREGSLATLDSFQHTTSGATMYVVKLNDRVDTDKYYKINSRAKQSGGYYSKFSKGGAIPGFLFKSEAAANEVAAWINKEYGTGSTETKTEEPQAKPKLYEIMHGEDFFTIDDLAFRTGKPKQEVWKTLNDLAARSLLEVKGKMYLPTPEFKVLLDDMYENPEGYKTSYGELYSNPLPQLLKAFDTAVTFVDDVFKKHIGDKIYKKAGLALEKITPEIIKKQIITNYGLPAQYVGLKKEALNSIARYKEMAIEIGDMLLMKDPKTKEKFSKAEQTRLQQIIRGSITSDPVLKARGQKAIEEIKKLEKLGKELEVLPIETYNSKLPRKRIAELLTQKAKAQAKLDEAQQKLDKKYGTTIAAQEDLLKQTKDAEEKEKIREKIKEIKKDLFGRKVAVYKAEIDGISRKVQNSYKLGGQGYFKRVYLNKEQAKMLKKYGYVKPTRLDLTSAIARKDIPFEVRKKMGEVLTASYPVAKSIMLEGKDVSFGRFFGAIAENPSYAMTKEEFDATPKDDWVKLPKDFKLGKLSEMYVPKVIADDINDVLKFTDPDNIETFFKQITANWKATKTIMNPSTHFRNIYSNSIMLDFSGVSQANQIRIIPEAIKMLYGKGQYAAKWKASHLDSTTFNAEELGKYLDNVVADRSFMDLSIPDKILKIYGKASLVDTKIGDTMGKIYQMEELVGKGIKFISELEKGKTVKEATDEANKWLFDYTEVPKLVRTLRTNPFFGVPFITWSYKALPRIIEAAVTRPLTFWKYPVIFGALMRYALQALGLDDDEWKELEANLPDKMIKGQWLLLPFRDEAGKLQTLDLTYILPYKDVYDIMESGYVLASSGQFNNGDSITEGVLGLIQAPVFKTAAELMTNRNTYSNMPIWYEFADTPGEKAIKAFDYMYKTYMPALAPEIPFLSTGGYAWNKLASVVMQRDDYYGRAFTLAPAISSSIFGIKTSPIEPEKNIERKAYSIQKQIGELGAKRNSILRDGGKDINERLQAAAELDTKIDQLRQQKEDLNVPKYTEEIKQIEKAIRSKQRQLSKIPLSKKQDRANMVKQINTLKIQLDKVKSSGDIYEGQTPDQTGTYSSGIESGVSY